MYVCVRLSSLVFNLLKCQILILNILKSKFRIERFHLCFSAVKLSNGFVLRFTLHMNHQCGAEGNDLCMHSIDVRTADWTELDVILNERDEASIDTFGRIEKKIEIHGFIDNS